MGCFLMIVIVLIFAGLGSIFGPGGALIGALIGFYFIAKLNGR